MATETLEKMRAKRPTIKLGPFNFVMGGKNPNQITVSGAGTTAVNGTYLPNGTLLNGKPMYVNTNDATIVISFDGTKWILSGGVFAVYNNNNTAVDGTPWVNSGAGDVGVLPAALVSFG